MKKHLYLAVYLLALFLVQVAGQKVFAREVYLFPQLVLLFVIAIALTSSPRKMVWFSFLSGFLMELFSGFVFGAYILAFLGIALAVYLVTRNLTALEHSIASVVFWVGLSTLALPLWVYGYNLFFTLFSLGKKIPIQDFYSWVVLWTVVVNILFFYPVRIILKILKPHEKSISN